MDLAIINQDPVLDFIKIFTQKKSSADRGPQHSSSLWGFWYRDRRFTYFSVLGQLVCTDLWPLIRLLREAPAATWSKQTVVVRCVCIYVRIQPFKGFCYFLDATPWSLHRSIQLLCTKISPCNDDITSICQTERVIFNLLRSGFVRSTNAADVSEWIDFHSTEYNARLQYWYSTFNLIFGIDLPLDSLRKAVGSSG